MRLDDKYFKMAFWLLTMIHVKMIIIFILRKVSTFIVLEASIYLLTFKVPITTAADNIHKYFFIFFQKK